MNVVRCGVFGLALTLCVSVTLSAGAEDKPAREKGKFGDRFGKFGQLLPEEAVGKLKLSDEQKEKVEKIQKDFQEKTKDAFEKSRDAIKKAFEDKDREAAKKAMDEGRDAGEKLRNEFLEKVAGVLKDDQKKTFEEIKKDLPKPGDFRPGGREGRPGPGGPGGPAGPGQLLPGPIQEQLKLTDEQKEKLAKLQKDSEAKMLDLLTDEQKKKLEELKKGGRPERKPKE